MKKFYHNLAFTKVCVLFLFLFLCLFLISSEEGVVSAYSTSTNQAKNSTWTPTEIEQKDYYGVNYENIHGIATDAKGSNDHEQINLFSMKTDGVSSKLVTWAVQKSNYSYVLSTLPQIAKDYEKKHPGWIVACGINSDMYYSKFGNSVQEELYFEPQPLYEMIADGQNRFTVNNFGTCYNMVGIKNDGSNNGFVTDSGGGAGYVLNIVSSTGKTLQTFPVAGINQKAQDSTTVWSGIFSKYVCGSVDPMPVTSAKKLFIVENAELAYLSNSETYTEYTQSATPGIPQNSFFGIGTISCSNLQAYTLQAGQFLVETDQKEVIAALADGARIEVERLFGNDKMNACESGTGFYNYFRINNQDQAPNPGDTYSTQKYARSLFGQDENGTYYLITADIATKISDEGNTRYVGLDYNEANAFASYYGLTDLYQQDGGGSATAVVRNIAGDFDVVNTPKDSGNPNSPRSVWGGLFFVVKDPNYGVSYANTTYHSITLVKKMTTDPTQITNLKVTVNDVTYDLNSDKQVIDGLLDNTNYTLEFTFDIIDETGSSHAARFSMDVKTRAFSIPDPEIAYDKITDSSVTFVKKDSEVASNIHDVVIHFGTSNYQMGDESSLTIEQLIKDMEYTYSIEYDYFDPITSRTFHNVIENLAVKTLSYQEPVINEWSIYSQKNDTIQLKYDYVDDDGVVTRAYVTYGDQEIDLSTNHGRLKIEELDFTSIYSFQLVLVLKIEDKEVKVTSDILTSTKVEITPTPTPDPDPEPEPTPDPDPTPDPEPEPTPDPDPEPTPDPTPTPDPDPEPVPEKKGCKKKTGWMELFSWLTIVSFVVLLKKKHE
jgi:hypothetical protein